MTWAFGLPLEPRAKIALLAIADNADDDGIAWPSRDLIASKSSQSRATINRRMKLLVDLRVVGVFERYREDGSQTTDEIRLDLALTPDEVMRRTRALKACETPETDGESADDDGGEGGCQVAPPPDQISTPGSADVTPRGYHCGNPHNEPSVEPDGRGDARARPVTMFTAGSRTLASVFWKALGFDGPLQIPPEFAGIDYRATMWEREGWPPDMIEAETRKFAPDRPFKPISYFEKVFATAFAKRQAPLPVVQVREAEQLTVNRNGRSGQQGQGNIIQAADRLVDALRRFDDDGTGPGGSEEIRSGALAPPVRMLPKG
jgi:hypothetical protein